MFVISHVGSLGHPQNPPTGDRCDVRAEQRRCSLLRAMYRLKTAVGSGNAAMATSCYPQ